MRKKRNIAVIHSRLKCIDGVSIEAEKWINAYSSLGYNVHLIAGRIGERTARPKLVIPEMDFTNAVVRALKKLAFESKLGRPSRESLNALIRIVAKKIKKELRDYIKKNGIEFLSVENAFSIPLNIPLGIALKEISEETSIPVLARHHDFYWERPYFIKHGNIRKILNEAFPPKGANIVHVTISRIANLNLTRKKNLNATTIPNTVDFKKIQERDDYNKDFRKSFGIRRDQLIFLQPTRITKRKSIEKSVELVAHMDKMLRKNNVLMITGPSLYGDAFYYETVMKRAEELGVSVILAQDKISLNRGKRKGEKVYSIDDAYVNADVITFPSETEGFGNPVLEACAYKKPLFVNKYPVFNEIARKNFDFITMDKELTLRTVNKLYEVLKNGEKRKKMVEKNYKIARKHYSQKALERSLSKLLRKSKRGSKKWRLLLQDRKI